MQTGRKGERPRIRADGACDPGRGQALEFLELLEGVRPYDRGVVEVSYSKLIKGFSEEGNPQASLGAIQEKEEADFELTTADFCHVISAFGADGEWNMASGNP